jgi:hypothetical protein
MNVRNGGVGEIVAFDILPEVYVVRTDAGFGCGVSWAWFCLNQVCRFLAGLFNWRCHEIQSRRHGTHTIAGVD